MTAHHHTADRRPEYRCPGGETPDARTSAPGLLPGAGCHDWAVALGLTAGSLTAMRIDPAPGCARAARHFLRTALRRWRLTRYADDAAAITAELVTNALLHALPRAPRRTTLHSAWLTLTRKEHALLCAVTDPSPDPPVLGSADPLAEGGRGLHVVSALSADWGWSHATGPGKTVWARIPTAAGEGRGRR
ncbi:ATP-binding protein [Streptomyces sp. 184]|uniref:ATP-binding protein n=1 Tax=Streptomyces sp. 184 TaxID=1827526 RepID=UPI003891E919